MTTLLDLADMLERRAKQLRQDASDVSIRTAIVALENLVFDTPVDSSRALSNWQIGIGEAAGASIEPYVFGIHGSTQEESGANALLVGKARLKDKKPGEVIYISNLLPYINRLNDGYSAQAPKGYVERVVLLARNVAKTP